MLISGMRIQEYVVQGLAKGFDHYIFLFCALLGGSAIFLLKGSFVPIPYADFLGIAVPLSIMVLYLCIVSIIPRMRLRLDQCGDNLYYLGFTYTLCSLAITLYRFHATEGVADYIVSNFGIALATTIFGVVLRVWLHQMREDPLDVEREARSEITDAVSRLRGEIDFAIREFNHFNRTLQQSAQEAIEAQGRIALESLGNSTKQYAEVTSRCLGYLENCFADFQRQANELNDNSERIVTALTSFSSELAANTQGVAIALTTFANRIDEVETPSDLLSVKLTPVFLKIAEAAEQTGGLISNELLANTQQVSTALTTFSERLNLVEAPPDLLAVKLAPIFQKIAEAAEQTAGRISSERQRNQNVTRLTSRLDELSGRIDGIFDRVADREERVTAAIQQASNVAGQTVELSRQIREWTEGLTNIEAKQTEILASLSRTSEEVTERDRVRDEALQGALTNAVNSLIQYETRVQSLLQSQSESFDTELQRAERAFRALTITLSDAASLLAAELGGSRQERAA
jgi:hypothetical protein